MITFPARRSVATDDKLFVGDRGKFTAQALFEKSSAWKLRVLQSNKQTEMYNITGQVLCPYCAGLNPMRA